MPYITSEARQRLEDGRNPILPGELNYLISQLCNNYIAMRGLNYTAINEVIGALECSKLETYRKVAANYEDSKERENGTVWTVV